MLGTANLVSRGHDQQTAGPWPHLRPPCHPLQQLLALPAAAAANSARRLSAPTGECSQPCSGFSGGQGDNVPAAAMIASQRLKRPGQY